MGYLIDTNILIELERGRLVLAQLDKGLSNESLALSSITVSELFHGVYRAQKVTLAQQRRQFVLGLLDTFPVIPFDLAAAEIHARVWAELQTQGRLIGAHDLLIGAAALAINYGVITLNRDEFERIPNLTVLSP